ncbi:MAG: crosslink repair DNA glycosylase YcaQ family protein [Robiginitomaculum sp.]
MPLKITNRQARHLLIDAHGLAKPPTGPLDTLAIIKAMGFVQLDTIRTVSRAHHHILWSRNQNYREPILWELLAENHGLFEHFTHDASILPMELYPVWQRQFKRMERRILASKRWNIAKPLHADIKARIRNEGPLSTHDFNSKNTGPKHMWERPPHKRALEYLWNIGELTTSHRENFTKFYDLSERVIPNFNEDCAMTDGQQLAWLCQQALHRLSIATPAQLQDFWGVANAADIKDWLKTADSVPVSIETAEGSWTQAYAAPDIEARLSRLEPPSARMRILNPFDPLIRNRKRLHRIFGFDYRIEIFVPAAQRKWGYYVYPLLQSGRIVGRIEVKADRKAAVLNVLKLWPETSVTWSPARQQKLEAELQRLARFVGARTVVWA